MPVYRATNKIILSSKLPNKIAGVNLWLDANDMSTINSGGVITDGTAVTTIKDKIGGVVFTGTGTFKKDTVVTGKNTILFNGTTNYIEAANVSAIAGTSKTIFYVLKGLVNPSAAYSFNMKTGSWSDSPIIPNLTMAIWGTAGYRLLGSNNSSGVSYSTFISSTSPSNTLLLFVVRKDTVKLLGYANGSNAVAAQSALTDVTATNFFSIGGTHGGGSPTNMNLCEVIHANTVLSSKDFNAIRQYIFNKWGV